MTSPAAHLLYVVMNGRVIGDVQRSNKRQMRLRYEDRPGRAFTPLSVSMPGPGGRYRERILRPWLEGLLPDRPETLRQWRRQFGIAGDSGPFPLLEHVGEDVAGAAQFVHPDRLETVQQTPGRLTMLGPAAIADMLRRAQADLPVTAAGGGTGKFSLAGAQAKIALHRAAEGWSDPDGATPSTHILKPAIPGMLDQDLVEAVTLRTASALGLRTASCSIEEFDGERAIVVSRYDRIRRVSGWLRVHQEDMCQAMAVWPMQKYESQGGPGAADVADLVRRASDRPEEDCERFAQALVFNWLTCGTDAHARNYSLLLSGDSVRLAPLYDLNSHLAYSDGTGNHLSMSVDGTYLASGLTMAHWERFAPALHLEPEWVRNEIGRQAAGLVEAMNASAGAADVARYDSHTIARLLDRTERWLGDLGVA